MRDGRQEGREGMVCCYAGGVQAGYGGEEVGGSGGVVDLGWWEGGHFLACLFIGLIEG